MKKLSYKARQLITATVRRCGSQRAAAKMLKLPNEAQLSKMLAGTIGETPAMRAAVERAERRARRAFLLERPDGHLDPVTIEHVRKQVAELRWSLEVLENTLR